MNAILKNQHGAALVAVLVVSTVLALVGTSYLSTSTHDAGLVTEQIQAAQALYAAETGIEYARRRLKSGDEWTSPGSWTTTINTPQVNGTGGTATVTFTYDDVNEIGTITSSSNFQGNQKQIVVSVSPIKETPFQQATCNCTSLTVRSSAMVDSYDSSEIYSAATASASGDVGSNGNIVLEGNAQIQGNLTASGNLTVAAGAGVSGSATLGGSASGGGVAGGVTQGVSPAPSPCDCNAIDVDTLVSNAALNNNNTDTNPAITGTDFYIGSTDTAALTAGTYYFTSFQIMSHATLNISGQVIIFLAGNGPFEWAGHSVSNTSDNVNNLKIYSNSTADIILGENSSFAGTIYAPRADITLWDAAESYGALFGKNTIIGGNAALHYDTHIPEVGEPLGIGTEVTVQTNSWSQI